MKNRLLKCRDIFVDPFWRLVLVVCFAAIASWGIGFFTLSLYFDPSNLLVFPILTITMTIGLLMGYEHGRDRQELISTFLDVLAREEGQLFSDEEFEELREHLGIGLRASGGAEMENLK